MFTVVSFYTPGYAGEAARLVESCEHFGIVHDVRAIDTLGDWQKNTSYKSAFLREVREEWTGPLVWLDADAEVVRYPTAFDVLDDCDVAAHYRRDTELLSGTLWLGDTQRCRSLLETWATLCGSRPMIWDQRNLAAAVGMVSGLRLHRLPAAYTCIFDAQDMLDQGDAVILHHQASRRLKHAGR
jgi:hypothetical protein